ncbi:MAG: hypothetical protein K8S97_16635, partial [Anaerolineae bacterium]|nr:hypothetical protein [Anaerolineae bacterium]
TGTCDAEGRYTFVAEITNAGRWDIQVRQAGHGEWLKIPLDADTVETLHDTDAADDDAAQGMTTLRIADSAASGSSDGGKLSAGQIVLMSASVIWGLVGTALYFARRKQERTH